jgi:30S ribosomal protein S31
MGKGDLRTRRGKIFRGTFGKSRPRKKKKKSVSKQVEQEGL